MKIEIRYFMMSKVKGSAFSIRRNFRYGVDLVSNEKKWVNIFHILPGRSPEDYQYYISANGVVGRKCIPAPLFLNNCPPEPSLRTRVSSPSRAQYLIIILCATWQCAVLVIPSKGIRESRFQLLHTWVILPGMPIRYEYLTKFYQ